MGIPPQLLAINNRFHVISGGLFFKKRIHRIKNFLFMGSDVNSGGGNITKQIKLTLCNQFAVTCFRGKCRPMIMASRPISGVFINNEIGAAG